MKQFDAKLKQRLGLIRRFYVDKRRVPSYSEMAILFGLKSKNAVFKIINKLIGLGFLKRDDKGHIILTKHPLYIKILGFVEAGFPSPAEEELLDTVSLDDFLIKNPSSTFMLKVSGDSMINAGILPGDLVIVDRSVKPRDKDIVIAQVDGQWTMKYLMKDKKINQESYILVPANKNYEPIYPQLELVIAGVVVSVVRKCR